MIAPGTPANETERLNELYKYELLDTVYEEEFDEIVQLASRLCKVPMSLISLVDLDRQWFKAKVGIDDAETKRNVSFCAHAILQDDIFEVADATKDERFHDNPFVVEDPYVRYYAGMPLVTQSGYKLGTLCILDRVPRELAPEQMQAIRVLSKQVIKLFELRARNKELNKVTGVQQQIMAIMAHDIRGPLASLKTTYELKNDDTFTDEEVKELEQLVPQQLDSTLQLLNNIVDWGTLLLREAEWEEHPFNLRDLVDECTRYLLLAANTKGNRFVNEVAADLEVKSAREGLEFVLRNLLGNANKFTEQGTITITAAGEDGKVAISVADTGIGMPQKAIDALNDRQFVPSTRGTQQEKGSGMGLKLIYEYLDTIAGAIRYAAREGGGTLVTVTLPS